MAAGVNCSGKKIIAEVYPKQLANINESYAGRVLEQSL